MNLNSMFVLPDLDENGKPVDPDAQPCMFDNEASAKDPGSEAGPFTNAELSTIWPPRAKDGTLRCTIGIVL